MSNFTHSIVEYVISQMASQNNINGRIAKMVESRMTDDVDVFNAIRLVCKDLRISNRQAFRNGQRPAIFAQTVPASFLQQVANNVSWKLRAFHNGRLSQEEIDEESLAGGTGLDFTVDSADDLGIHVVDRENIGTIAEDVLRALTLLQSHMVGQMQGAPGSEYVYDPDELCFFEVRELDADTEEWHVTVRATDWESAEAAMNDQVDRLMEQQEAAEAQQDSENIDFTTTSAA